MAHRLVTLFTAIATGAAVAVVALPQAATAAVSPRTAFTALMTEGAAGSYLLGEGQTKEYVDSAVGVTASQDTLGFQTVALGAWTAMLSGPTDSDLAEGTYTTARFNGAGVVGLDIYGDGRGCNEQAGTLVVHQVTRDAGTGTITSFAGTYSTRCEKTMPANVGELRFNSTVDYERFGSQPLGTTSAPRTVTVAAAAETTFGAATVQGPDAASFLITSDTCSGQTVAAGQSCSLGLAAHVRELPGHAAALRLPSASGDRIVGLTAVGHETAKGAYTAVKPARLLDTRKKVGVSTTTPIGAGKYIDLQVTGRGGVPASGAGTVVLNMTVVAPTSAGYLTVYSTGTSRPTASSVNFNSGWTGANLITVRLGTGGKVRIWNYAGNTHVVADVMGYYHAASSTSTSGYGGYGGVEPTRILDTRTTTLGDGKPLPGWSYLWVVADFDTLNSHVKAFAVNITVTKPTGTGYLSAWDGQDATQADFPTTSTLNFTAGRTVPNMAIVPTSPCGPDCGADAALPKIGILNGSSGSSHVVVDIVGFFDDNTTSDLWRFTPLTAPTRIVNTKTNQGLSGAFGPGATRKVTAPASVAGYNTMALVTNTTGNRPTSNTVITLWSAALPKTPKPTVSNLNPYAGQVVSNMTITDVGDLNDFWVNNSAGTTNLVIDAAGSMEFYPAFVVPAGGAGASPDRAVAGPHASGPRLTVQPVAPMAPRQR